MSPQGQGGPIRVLIADDQRVVRDGLSLLVRQLEGVEVVATAADGAEAVAAAGACAPDVVLMDLRMPGTGGVEATRLLREGGGPAVVILTTYLDDDSLFPALQAGAAGYLTKDATAEQIEAAVRAVSRGETWLEPAVQARLVEALAPQHPPGDDPGAPAGELPDGLTAREGEVLALLAGGLSNDEIAAELVLGRATVKTHINRIFAKTGARDRAQAVRYAYRTGIARPGA
jgi:DNA-binding NarL/FixJ family response regulator